MITFSDLAYGAFGTAAAAAVYVAALKSPSALRQVLSNPSMAKSLMNPEATIYALSRGGNKLLGHVNERSNETTRHEGAQMHEQMHEQMQAQVIAETQEAHTRALRSVPKAFSEIGEPMSKDGVLA